MKNLLTLFFLTLILFVGCGRIAAGGDVLGMVDPFIGTSGHGHTFPGAGYPFGMVQLSPDTGLEGWDWCSGYHYSDSSIIGFSHTHLSGTGRSDLMDVLLMPTVGEIRLNAGTKENPDSGYRSRFVHEREWASPGYYRVELTDYDVLAELTVSPRCGFHRYTFPESAGAHIILDLSHHYSSDSVVFTSLEVVDSQTITGRRNTRGWGEPGEKYWSEQQLFYAIRVSKPFLSTEAVENVKAALNFETKDGEQILVKVGISAVSVENALENISAEIPGWDFDAVLHRTQEAWRNELSKIEVDAPEDVRTIFYTALYHSMLSPSLYNDVNGEYRGFDGKTHPAGSHENYTVLSLWDTFRAENPLLTLLNPDLTNSLMQSMMRQYREYGLLPVWPLWSSETNCMIGYHSVPVIVDAWFKGIRDYDVEEAYRAMKTSAMQNDFGVKELKMYGYIPYDKYNKSVSTALEYCFDDWCIAQMAKELGKKDDYEYFMNRATSYKTYFDREYGLMNGVSSEGKFRRPFDPFYSSYGECDWVEGNSWQYSFFVPHDIEGLMELYGGRERFAAALDKLFSVSPGMSGNDVPIDITGLIGQYAHGNEPSHHVAYLYNYAGQPHKAQERLHEIMTTLYTTRPDGLCGNEDCGQMSAWYVFSAMGFYPVNPASGEYVFGKPMVNKAVLRIGDKTFTVRAHGLNEKNIYIQSVKLNGENYDKLYITHRDIVNGGELEFTMGSRTVWLDELDLTKADQSAGKALANQSMWRTPLSIAGERYERGVGTHAASIFRIRLDGKTTRFRTLAGIDDSPSAHELKQASAEFMIIADGKTVWRSGPMHGGDRAREADIPLEGVKSLILRVEHMGDGIAGDRADWVDARFEVTGDDPVAVVREREADYILTPPPPRAPQINAPYIYGARRGNPVLFTMAVSGERPVKITADKLPEGLSLDTATGIISGRAAAEGIYDIFVTATNRFGADARNITLKIGDTISLTPPMGWNSWNIFGADIDDQKIRDMADAMIALGLDNYGYSYINIDDGWQGERGGKYNAIMPNGKFPDMKALVDYVHGKGLKIGIYSSPWVRTFAGYIGGSADTREGKVVDPGRRYGEFSFARNDVRQWAEWGFDYLKYDWVVNDIAHTEEMAGLLDRSGRDIVFSISNAAPFELADDWKNLTNARRTTGDIHDSWCSLTTIGFMQDRWQPYARPGSWNDPDMLIVGEVGWGKDIHPTRLTPNEQYLHMSLWSILAAPLLIGCDLRKTDHFTLNLLKNREVLEVSQDIAGIQGKRVRADELSGTEIWSRPLSDGSIAVGLFNLSEEVQRIGMTWNELGLAEKQLVRNLWTQRDEGVFSGFYSSNVPLHGVTFIKIMPVN